MKILRKIAGWWKIKDVDSGQIDWEQPDKKGLINAIPGEEDVQKLYNGDGPADIMSHAFEQIEKEYRNAWNREPTPEEMQAVFNFVFNGWKSKN